MSVRAAPVGTTAIFCGAWLEVQRAEFRPSQAPFGVHASACWRARQPDDSEAQIGGNRVKPIRVLRYYEWNERIERMTKAARLQTHLPRRCRLSSSGVSAPVVSRPKKSHSLFIVIQCSTISIHGPARFLAVVEAERLIGA